MECSWVRAVGSGQYGSRVGVSGLADLRAGSQLDTHAAPPCDERGRAVRAVRGPGHVAPQAHWARAPHPSTAPLRATAPAGSLLLFALRLPLPRHREQVSLEAVVLTSPTSTWCGVRRRAAPYNNITSTTILHSSTVYSIKPTLPTPNALGAF